MEVEVEVGAGVDPVEVDPDPEFVAQAVSTKESTVTSEIISQIGRRLST